MIAMVHRQNAVGVAQPVELLAELGSGLGETGQQSNHIAVSGLHIMNVDAIVRHDVATFPRSHGFLLLSPLNSRPPRIDSGRIVDIRHLSTAEFRRVEAARCSYEEVSELFPVLAVGLDSVAVRAESGHVP
ncbi:hypothetical protein ACIQ6K_13840 [Streptomyces sp. NPDC096354]|uniref:hypothetical protein n=1 Tax=Streptomyces sp. NPDC096354 TaxID=3366088 RepID=UPI003821EC84